MGMAETPIDEFINRFRHNAEHQRKIGDLHGCLEFRQLAEWLEQLQKIKQIVDEWKHDHDNLNYADDSYYWSKVREVIEDGNE